ncbi:BQ2448_4943 [Microbotryum intermedium]|uniref:BQ2448_4942 protein n=1 Tax=Microbotryum intermedium TaxID=269621 RepID=A0A238FHH5_9BASI|nr:BQ2448_4942 [Microbotryum intermedium]SCV72249.1 BQ2448_4943 [Microbotryum intermedium]
MDTKSLALGKGIALFSRSRAVLLLSAIVVLGSSSSFVNARVVKRQDDCGKDCRSMGFCDPRIGGGSWLTNATDTGLGEPLNVVLSSNSDPYVLNDLGFRDWALSIQYGLQFLNITLGGLQQADLGDGEGLREWDGGHCVNQEFPPPKLLPTSY